MLAQPAVEALSWRAEDACPGPDVGVGPERHGARAQLLRDDGYVVETLGALPRSGCGRPGSRGDLQPRSRWMWCSTRCADGRYDTPELSNGRCGSSGACQRRWPPAAGRARADAVSGRREGTAVSRPAMGGSTTYSASASLTRRGGKTNGPVYTPPRRETGENAPPAILFFSSQIKSVASSVLILDRQTVADTDP